MRLDWSGGGGKILNIPVVHCSGVQNQFHKTDDRYIIQQLLSLETLLKIDICYRFFLKVRDHSFKYQLNMKDGVVRNKSLFDRTVGLARTL